MEKNKKSRFRSYGKEQVPKVATTPAKGKNSSVFINVTDVNGLDKSAQTQVRAEVMRNYHRRRIQKEKGIETEDPTTKSSEPPTTTVPQRQKFRFYGEEGFRPWVPAKSVKKTHKPRRSLAEKAIDRNDDQSYGGERQWVDPGQLLLEYGGDMELRQEFPYEYLGDTDWEKPPILFNFDESTIDPNLSSLSHSPSRSVLYISPSSGLLDPFGSMALPITRKTQEQIHFYFNTRLKSARLMMPMRKGLHSLALHDPAMFHTFLVHYVAKYNSFTKNADTTEVLYHRTSAISLVNERLFRSDGVQLLSDETVAAVANLAIAECSNGSPESGLLHWRGLEQLVSTRGGLVEGGFHPHVRRLIEWTDFHCGTALSAAPRFHPLAAPHLSEYTTSSEPQGQGETLDTLLAGLRHLTISLQSLQEDPVEREEDIWYCDRLYYLQSQLTSVASKTQGFVSALETACATAALIYCGHHFRDIPYSFTSMIKAASQLRGRLGDVELGIEDGFMDIDRVFWGKFLWANIIGGMASASRPDRDWYMIRLRTSCMMLDLSDWEDVRELLSCYVWQTELDEDGKRLWDDSNIRETMLAN